jgi:universal stress protein A
MKTSSKTSGKSAGAARLTTKRTVRKFLVPTDFSPASITAIDYAASLARQFGGKIVLLYVMEPVIAPEYAALALLASDAKAKAEMCGRLEKLAAEHGLDKSLLDQTLVRQGTPFHEIALAAETVDADLIVIATHGYTGLKRVMLGSTTERVVRHARCPVLVVPTGK